MIEREPVMSCCVGIGRAHAAQRQSETMTGRAEKSRSARQCSNFEVSETRELSYRESKTGTRGYSGPVPVSESFHPCFDQVPRRCCAGSRRAMSVQLTALCFDHNRHTALGPVIKVSGLVRNNSQSEPTPYLSRRPF